VGNTGTHVAFVGNGGSSPLAMDNFVDSTETSLECTNNPDRLSIESGNGVSCESGLADSDVCLYITTDVPTLFPTNNPVILTGAPSDTPTTTAPTAAPTTATPSTSPTQRTNTLSPSISLAPSDPPSSSTAPSNSITETPTTSLVPSMSLVPTVSSSPTEVEITANPTNVFPTPVFILNPISRPSLGVPSFRPDCPEYGKGDCKTRSKKFKSKKKEKFKSKESKKQNKKRSKKDKKDSKKEQKTKKVSKKGKGGYWKPLGGARGAYRNYSFQSSRFSNTWQGDNGRGWKGIDSVDSGDGDRRELVKEEEWVNVRELLEGQLSSTEEVDPDMEEV
jgi:hypothetical protein